MAKRPRDEPLTADEQATQASIEAQLFGATKKPKARSAPSSTKELAPAPLPDDQLFVLDVDRSSEEGSEDESQGDGEEQDEEETDYEASAAESEDEEEEEAQAELASQDESDPEDPHKAHQDGKPAWTDPDDKVLLVPLSGVGARAADGTRAGTHKLKKLRLHPEETSVNGDEYARRLRALHSRSVPAPPWAARMFRRPASDDDGQVGTGSSLAALLSSDRPQLSSTSKGKLGPLPAHQLVVTRTRDVTSSLDQEERSAVDTVQFYPTSTGGAPLLLTSSRDRRLRLWSLPSLAHSTSTTNQSKDSGGQMVLQAFIPDLPIRTASWATTGSAATALIAGDRPFLYSWDLGSQQILRSSPWRLSNSRSADGDERRLSKAKPLPPSLQSGKASLVAVQGRQGAIHLLDWGRSGAGSCSVISSLQAPGILADVAWDPTSGSVSGSAPRLLTLTENGEIGLWDTRMLSCTLRMADTDLFRPSILSPSPDGSTLSVGSSNGLMSMYDFSTFTSSSSLSMGGEEQASLVASGQMSIVQKAKPRTTLSNLTTSISTIAWHPSSEMMIMASRAKRDAFRAIHSKSATVFANWPTANTPLAHVTSADFDPLGRSMAIANDRGKVLLYRLQHYD